MTIAKVLVPIDITAAMVITNPIPEPDASRGEVAYNNANAYKAGDTNITSPTLTGRRFTALQDMPASSGRDPANIATRGVWWADAGATNKAAFYDGRSNYQSISATSLTLVLKVGFFNGLYLCGIDAKTLDITIKDATGGNVIYSATKQMDGAVIMDYYEYCFAPFLPISDFTVEGITPYSASEITITLTAAVGGTAKLGLVAAGDFQSLGTTLMSPTSSPKGSALMKTNSDGSQSFVSNKGGNDLSFSTFIELQDANSVDAALKYLIGRPAFWICTGATEYNNLRTWGIGNGSITNDGFQHASGKFNITGLFK